MRVSPTLKQERFKTIKFIVGILDLKLSVAVGNEVTMCGVSESVCICMECEDTERA